MVSTAVLIDKLDQFYGWEPPALIGVAVSGGSDSLALLHLLNDWGRAKIVAATVDHGLRKEAAEEAAYVGRICAALNIPHDTLRWTAWNGSGNVQDEARRARYGLLARWGKKRGVDFVTLGHTRDDVAETFLMRLARKSGVDGLAAMAARANKNGMRFDRPLLDVSRADLRHYLHETGVAWVDDPSNDNDAFDRVRARQLLENLGEMGITSDVLGSVAAKLRAERSALGQAVYELADRITHEEAGDVIIDAKRFSIAHPELQRRLLNVALQWVASADYTPRHDALMEVAQAIDMRQTKTLHGCLITAGAADIRIGREFNAVWDATAQPSALWDGRWQLTGPAELGDEVRALGEEGLGQLPDWRAAGLPRRSLMASPSVWRADRLIAAPLASFNAAWSAKCATSYISSLLTH